MKALVFAVVLVSSSVLAASEWGRARGVVSFNVEGPIDDVTGTTRVWEALLDFAPDTALQMTGAVAVPLSTLQTGIDERDRDMRVEFLEVDRYPFAVLVIDRLDKASFERLDVGVSAQVDVVGSFELHGVRRAIRVPVTMVRTKSGVQVRGGFVVPFADYGISRPRRLFFKLGDTARITFDLSFAPRAALVAAAPQAKPAAPLTATVKTVQAESKPTKPAAPKKPKPALLVTALFRGDDAKARGERLFHDASLGGEGNRLTCFHCHAKTDEHKSAVLADGKVRAANTLFDAGKRTKFWNGFATTVAGASAICQKAYMLGEGLSPTQQADLTAFIEAISPHQSDPLDYAETYRSMESLLRDPTGGNAKRGKALADTYCMTCHLDGRVGPVWAPGLYEPDWVVRRVRRLDGHSNRQMPNWTQKRLSDDDLRDIVTYLASEPPIFDRRRAP